MNTPDLMQQPTAAADSTEPERIPASFKAAFAYADGRYKWTPAQCARFEWIGHITVTGDQAAAAYARFQDIERFDATPAQFPLFAEKRLNLGHSCGIGYTSLDNVGAVVDELFKASMGSDPWKLWVAWWWRQPVPPTQAQVHAQLARLGVDIAAARIAACQWRNGPSYDTTVLYEPHVLHRPQGWPS
ncbi:MAG TPA: hypothetical protein VNO54_24715 [Streptosporangiaceae bacterium]|nr:hypothetical protein [Streptosporangiaceae bacterium]